MKKVLIIKAHPKEDSFCNEITNSYIKGLKTSGNNIKILILSNLNLESFIKYNHKEIPNLKADLLEAQNLITWSNHLVFTYPIWWASSPALFKLFFEIVFHSGFAFKYQKSTGLIPKW